MYVKIASLKALADELDVPFGKVLELARELKKSGELPPGVYLCESKGLLVKTEQNFLKKLEKTRISLSRLSELTGIPVEDLREILKDARKSLSFYFSRDGGEVIGKAQLLEDIAKVIAENFYYDFTGLFSRLDIKERELLNLIEEAARSLDRRARVCSKGLKVLVLGEFNKRTVEEFLEPRLREEIDYSSLEIFSDFPEAIDFLSNLLARRGYLRVGWRFIHEGEIIEIMKKRISEDYVLDLQDFSKSYGVDLEVLKKLSYRVAEDSIVYFEDQNLLLDKVRIAEEVKKAINPYTRLPLSDLSRMLKLDEEVLEKLILDFAQHGVLPVKLDPVGRYVLNLEGATIPVDSSEVERVRKRLLDLIAKVEAL